MTICLKELRTSKERLACATASSTKCVKTGLLPPFHSGPVFHFEVESVTWIPVLSET